MISEKEIQNKLITLSSYLKEVYFTQEYTLVNQVNNNNDINKGNDTNFNIIRNPKVPKTRRLDLIQEFDEYVRVIELKMKVITVEDVATVIARRGYLRLSRNHFNKEVYLYIMNPYSLGIEEDALNLINEIPNCFYMNIEELGKAIFSEYLSSLPKEGKWKAKEVYEEYRDVIGNFNLDIN